MSGPKGVRINTNRRVVQRRFIDISAQLIRDYNTIKMQVINTLNILIDNDILNNNRINLIESWINNADVEINNSHYFRAINQIKGVRNYLNRFDVDYILRKREEKRIKQQKILEEKERQEQKLIDELTNRYEKLKDDISKLKKVSRHSNNANLMLKWLEEGYTNFQNTRNIQQFQKSFNGVSNFISTKNINIEEILKDIEQKEQYLEKINNILSFKEIVNEGIKERVSSMSEEIKQAISENKPIDVQKIDSFTSYVEEIYNNYQMKEVEKEYVSDSIKSALDNSSEGPDGSILGSINGVPIKVSIENEENVIFNIDETKGNCIEIMEEIKKRLAEKDIFIGSVSVENTGQTLYNNTNQLNNELHA